MIKESILEYGRSFWKINSEMRRRRFGGGSEFCLYWVISKGFFVRVVRE